MVWQLSGMPALGRAMVARIEEGAGAQLLREIEVEIANLDQSAALSETLGRTAEHPGGGCRMEPEALARALSEIESKTRAGLVAGLAQLHGGLAERTEAARQTFVARATTALVSHLELYGELSVWSYDPCGLRVLLRSAFQRYVRGVSHHAAESMAAASAELSALYREAFVSNGAPPTLEPPPLPAPDAPIVLGQTIALDLRGSWWVRFWRRRKGYRACADDFATLIRQETQPILNALLTDNAARYEATLVCTLMEFIEANRKIMLDLATPASSGAAHPEPRKLEASR